jgi:hypothetical protein
MIPIGDQAALRPFLLPGERLVWSGRPQQGLIFELSDLLFVPASIAAGATLGWLAREQSGGDMLALIPHALALLGLLYTAVGRFLHEAWARRRLLYAVTNQRVLTLHGGRRLESHDLAWLPMLELEQQERSGTITIEDPPEPAGLFESAFQRISPLTKGFRFFRVERPGELYDLICRESARRRADLNRDLPVGLF